MSERYKGKIKVVGPDFMCFPVDPTTLKAVGCSVYDPYAIADPDPTPVETISYAEWSERAANRHAPAQVHPDIAKAQAIPFDVNDGRPTKTANNGPAEPMTLEQVAAYHEEQVIRPTDQYGNVGKPAARVQEYHAEAARLIRAAIRERDELRSIEGDALTALQEEHEWQEEHERAEQAEARLQHIDTTDQNILIDSKGYPRWYSVKSYLRMQHRAEQAESTLQRMIIFSREISIALGETRGCLSLIEDELGGMKASIELRYNSDMRAIKQWQAAHPGNDLTWPDHADLSVWLMEQLAAATAKGGE